MKPPASTRTDSERSEARTCAHCGTPFRAKDASERFCCKGCAYAYQLIHDKGLDHYYQIKAATTPLRSLPFGNQDFRELTAWQQAAEMAQTGPVIRDRLRLNGVSCAGCVWLIERIFQECDGGIAIEVHTQKAEAEITWERGLFDVAKLGQELRRCGYVLAKATAGSQAPVMPSSLSNRIGQCGFLAMNTMLFTLPRYLGLEADDALTPLFQLLVFGFATLSVLVGGSYFIGRAIQSLRHGVLHIDLPIALGIVAAYLGSVAGWMLQVESLLYFDFVAIFTLLMLIGRWTQEATLERTRKRLLSDGQQLRDVTVMTETGESTRQAVSELVRDQTFTLSAGDMVPVCAINASDTEASVTLEWITGEAETCVIKPGQLVPAGAQNLSDGERQLKAVESWQDSLVSRLLAAKPSMHRDHQLETLMRRYLIVILILSAMGGLSWWLLSGWIMALQVAISILVVSCPCALGVALPLASELATLRLKQIGVFVNRSDALRRMQAVQWMVFDKTGTLTLEQPELIQPDCLEKMDTEAREALCLLVSQSLHPVSRSLREALMLHYHTSDASETVQEHPGMGVSVRYRGKLWTLGRPGWQPGGHLADTPTSNDTELRCEGVHIAAFRFKDAVRDGAQTAIDTLKRLGKRVVILSGDRQQKVDSMAASLGIAQECALGGLSPEAKAQWIEQQCDSDVLMIGDGLNDALAFDAATVTGTPVIDKGLLEPRADFFFLDRGLDGILAMIHTANQLRKKQRILFQLALSYNVVALIICFAGWMNPLLAAVLMPLSSLVTIMVALSMRTRNDFA